MQTFVHFAEIKRPNCHGKCDRKDVNKGIALNLEFFVSRACPENHVQAYSKASTKSGAPIEAYDFPPILAKGLERLP